MAGRRSSAACRRPISGALSLDVRLSSAIAAPTYHGCIPPQHRAEGVTHMIDLVLRHETGERKRKAGLPQRLRYWKVARAVPKLLDVKGLQMNRGEVRAGGHAM